MRYYTRKIKKFLPGDMIFTENSECDGMYIIDKGKVRIFKTVTQGGETKEIELCQLGNKAMFGEMAMIDESRRSASVQAVLPTECTIITRQIFEDQLSKIPPWMVNLIKILVQRLRDTNDKLRQNAQSKTTTINRDDTGSVIVVQGEKEGQVSGSPGVFTSPGKSKPQVIKPEDIIDDLFKGA